MEFILSQGSQGYKAYRSGQNAAAVVAEGGTSYDFLVATTGQDLDVLVRGTARLAWAHEPKRRDPPDVHNLHLQ